ncbi:MAG TPA: OmpA family protein [Bacteroidales bacterium]|nr:OmpA family protein [Bacteroidales bacterium]
MKRTIMIMAAISLMALGARTQDASWYFMTGPHFVDYYAPDGGGYLATDNWNGDAMPKQFYVGRSLIYGLELGTSLSLLQIQDFPDELVNKNFLDWDLMLSYKPLYKKVINENHWFDPYLWIGGGLTRINEETNPLVNVGAGIDFWLNEWAAFNVHTAYDAAMGDGKAYTHHGVGVKFRIKGNKGDRGAIEPMDLSTEKKQEINDQIRFAAKNIQFETSSDVIRQESYKDLDNIVSIMKNFPNTKFDIHGHTDNTGDDAMNLDLSKRRSASVKKYFMDKGIDGSRLFPEGYGETKPIATNDTPEGRAQNRRVEIKLR